MKPILRTTILAAVLTVLGGCRSVQSPPWYTDAWRGFPYQEVKEKLNEYRSVLLVCVTEDHGEQGRRSSAGPSNLDRTSTTTRQLSSGATRDTAMSQTEWLLWRVIALVEGNERSRPIHSSGI